MSTTMISKYESRTINTQPEFGDLVECSREEMKSICIENDWDFSGWNPETLADYLRPENFPGCPAAYERAIRRFADKCDVDYFLSIA